MSKNSKSDRDGEYYIFFYYVKPLQKYGDYRNVLFLFLYDCAQSSDF